MKTRDFWWDASGIYEIVNTLTGARYYGSAQRLGGRLDEHKRKLRRGIHHNVPLQNAWNKYGESVMIFRPLAVLEKDQIRTTEQRLLDLMYGCAECYNVSRDTRSPMTGRKQTAEHTERVASANRGRKRDPAAIEKTAAWHRGRTHSAEHREKVGAAFRGKKRRPDLVEKSAASHRGRKRSQETRERIAASKTGLSASAETRAKMSAAKLGRKRSPESVAKSAASHRGVPRTPEQRASISAGMTEAGRKKLSEQMLAYWATKKAQQSA